MFYNTPKIMRKIKSACLYAFNVLENNGTANFYKNGESTTIENIFRYFSINASGSYVIFDIGANNGHYTELLIDKATEKKLHIIVHLFEPTHNCFNEVDRKFISSNIIKNNFGVSNNDTEALIYFDKENSEFASLYKRELENSGIVFSKSEQIKLKRLDSYIEKNKITHVNFIKIDIEGHELHAFEGLGKYLNSEFIDFIQFEYGGANLDSRTSLKDFYKLFLAKGFKIAKLMPKGLEVRAYLPYMENFNFSNYMAISENILKRFV